jgi:hypothetical protein
MGLKEINVEIQKQRYIKELTAKAVTLNQVAPLQKKVDPLEGKAIRNGKINIYSK